VIRSRRLISVEAVKAGVSPSLSNRVAADTIAACDAPLFFKEFLQPLRF
jgi:hypothetical protein